MNPPLLMEKPERQECRDGATVPQKVLMDIFFEMLACYRIQGEEIAGINFLSRNTYGMFKEQRGSQYERSRVNERKGG